MAAIWQSHWNNSGATARGVNGYSIGSPATNLAWWRGLGAFHVKAKNDTPFIPVNRGQFGEFGWSTGVILGFASVILVGLIGQGRIMLAMARDGMLPAAFGRVHATRKRPWVAHASMMGGTALLAGFVPVEVLSTMTSVGTLLAFAVVCAGVLVLRWREPERPFRAPGGAAVPGLGIAVCLAMMPSLLWETWLRLGAWFVLGFVVYAAYSHIRAAVARNAGQPELATSAPRS